MRKKYQRKVFKSYTQCSIYERSKLEKGYKRLKEYKDYYLYGKYDVEGNLLYRECFSKFDIDGATKPKNDLRKNQPIFKFG